jgi:hypothetical protein
VNEFPELWEDDSELFVNIQMLNFSRSTANTFGGPLLSSKDDKVSNVYLLFNESLKQLEFLIILETLAGIEYVVKCDKDRDVSILS